MNRNLTSTMGLVILAALFVGVNILALATLRSARIDFTEGRLYTLTDGSKNIARSIDEQITLDFYFSAKLTTGRPGLQSHGRRVRELLQEYERAADGMINLRFHDPEPFSDVEDDAVQFGLRGVPMGDGGERFYFGLVGSNAVGSRAVIPYFDPQEEEFLEYEISRVLYALSNPKRRVMGLVTTLEIGGRMADEEAGVRGSGAWQIAREIGAMFETRRIDPRTGRLPQDIDVLMVVHPKQLPDPIIYAIDQYVLRGGRALIFVDPHSESDRPEDTEDPLAAMTHDTTSTLPRLFEAWGIAMNPDICAVDMRNAQEAFFQSAPGRQEPVSYIPWLGLGREYLNASDIVTGKLGRVNVASGGVLDRTEDATTEWTPLMWTSEQSMRFDSLMVRMLPDPKRLAAEFKAEGEELVLAARLTGRASTAFPEGPPEGSPISGPESHVDASGQSINVIVVADTDILADRFWLQQDRFGSVRKIADNADLVINALDQLSGSEDLISLRARGTFARPFKVVEDLRAEAEAQYRSRERELQAQLRRSQQRVEELRRQAPESETGLILSPEVQEEITTLQQEMLETRRELRRVQLNLRRDVEQLGTRVKIINTALTPTLIAIIAVGLGVYRTSRRKADRRAMAHT